VNADLLALIWVQSAILLGLAWVVCRFAKAPAVRQWVCRGALLGAVVLALGAPFGSIRKAPVARLPFKPIVVRVPVPDAAQASGVPAQAEPIWRSALHAPPAVEWQPSRPAPSPTPARRVDLAACLASAWGLGSAVLALYALVGLGLLLRLRLTSKPCEDPRAESLANACREKLGLRRLRLRETTGSGTPFVAGVFAPSVYLAGDWALTQDDETLEAFLLHEAAHIARRDLLWSALHRLVQVMLWPQPFVWLLGRPMARAAEELCDAQVVASGTAPTAYADRLLRLAESRRTRLWAIGYEFGIAHSRSSLAGRIVAILSGTHARELLLSRRSRFGLLLGLLAVAGATALVFAAPPRPQNSAAPAPKLPDASGLWDREITLKVLSPDRKPVAEATAWVLYGTVDSGQGPVRPAPQRIEVRNGVATFRLKQGAFADALIVDAPGYGLSAREQTFDERRGAAGAETWSPSNEAEIVMSPESRIQGRLLLPSGQPAVGVRVFPVGLSCDVTDSVTTPIPHGSVSIELFSEGFSFPNMRDRYATVTDGAGRFEIRGLPQGTSISLDTDDARFAAFPESSWHETARSAVTNWPDIRMVPAATIEGRVLARGMPVSGVPLNFCADHIHARMAQTTTDDAGRFRLGRLVAGTYTIAAQPAKPLSARLAGRLFRGVAVHTGQHRGGLDIILTPGAVIEGRVTLAHDRAVPAIPVDLLGPWPFPGLYVLTDKNGRYRMRVSQGTWEVCLVGLDVRPRVVTVKDGEHRAVNFRISLR
jgi:beta-lactamase regulating signal transducer with metallopeptidase domain